jgi:hypothetical protein
VLGKYWVFERLVLLLDSRCRNEDF